jgi:hypothetical protein
MHFSTLCGNSKCSSPEVVLAFLLYEGSTIHNVSDQFVSCVYFFFVDFAFHPFPQTKMYLYTPTSNSCISTPIENWTHVYMNLFTRNCPYCHLLKYLLFLLKHPVCIYMYNVQDLKFSLQQISILWCSGCQRRPRSESDSISSLIRLQNIFDPVLKFWNHFISPPTVSSLHSVVGVKRPPYGLDGLGFEFQQW